MSTTLTHFKIGRKNFHLIAFKDYTDGALWLYTIVCYKIIFEWKPVWKGFWQSWQNVSFYLHFWVCKVITLVCLLVWTNYQNNFTKLSFNCHNFKVTQFANDYFAFKIHGEILDVSEWQNCAKYWKFNRWGINCGQKLKVIFQ